MSFIYKVLKTANGNTKILMVLKIVEMTVLVQIFCWF